MRILYCGSDEFSVKVLQTIKSLKFLNINVLGPENKLLTQNRVTTIYKPTIVKYCEKNQISFKQDINLIKDEIERREYDAIIAVSFNKFLTANLLKYFKYSFNLHPSLLPFYKGSSPIQRSLINNEKYIGVTIQDIDTTKFDNGKIYMQTRPLLISHLTNKQYNLKSVEYVYDKDKTGSLTFEADNINYRVSKIEEPNSKKFNFKYDLLRNSLSEISGEMLKAFLKNKIYSCKTTDTNNFIQQLPCIQPLFAKKITNQTFQMNWLKDDINKLTHKVSVTDDCCYSFIKENYNKNGMELWRPRKLFIRNVEVFTGTDVFKNTDRIGSFKLVEDYLLIKCLNNNVLKVNEVKPEGIKKFIKAEEFINSKYKKLYKHRNYWFSTIKEVREEYEQNLSKYHSDKSIESIIYNTNKSGYQHQDMLNI